MAVVIGDGVYDFDADDTGDSLVVRVRLKLRTGKKMNELHEIMIAPEVAVLLRMCLKTVYRLAESGTIPGYRIGRSWRFNRADILKFIIDKRKESEGAHHVPGAVPAVRHPQPS